MENQELFERLKREGECWHELELHNMEYRRCKLCSRGFSTENGIVDSLTGEHINPDFSTWEGFGWLWERVIEKEWWNGFLAYRTYPNPKDKPLRAALLEKVLEDILRESFIELRLINPTCFTEALKEYLEG